MSKRPKYNDGYQKPYRKRNSEVRTLSDAVDRLNMQLFRPRGFAQKEIIARWPDIVGPALADCSIPQKLVFSPRDDQGGTLHVIIQGSFAQELHHHEAIILERINSYYGYEAIEKMVYHHGTVEPRKRYKAPPKPVLSDSQNKQLVESLDSVKDDKLKGTLLRLGEQVLGEKKVTKNQPVSGFSRRGKGRLTS